MFRPNMGIKAKPQSGLIGGLLSPVQQRLVGLLFGQPDRRFQGAELIRLVGSGTGAVHRQLQRFVATGLVNTSRLGNQKYYQANPASPIFSELQSIALKTSGLLEPLRQALVPFADQITVAFVYGSVASGTDRAASDIDLMVLSASLSYDNLFEALQLAEQVLARPINPTVMAPEEWQRQRAATDSFVARVGAAAKLFVIGGADGLSGAGEAGRNWDAETEPRQPS